jgi:predicted AAA+ superfamily ATPase
MVLLAGPRQCGKTTLARSLLDKAGGAYFSWDVASHRKALREEVLPADAPLWVFDEIHKLRTWRRWLKGVYDQHGGRHSIHVTGSARLDAYNRSGESLQGRYFLHRLHPFTLAEVCSARVSDDIDAIPELAARPPSGSVEAIDGLLTLGGFPEPFLSASGRSAGRWRLGYGSRLVR